MQLSDFDYNLPDALIATRPRRPRSAARLLVAGEGRIEDRIVRDLPNILRPGDRLVLNDTQVIPARITGFRHRPGAQDSPGAGEARIEVTLLEPQPDGNWTALVRPLRKLRIGEVIRFPGGLSATYLARATDGSVRLSLSASGAALDAALDTEGQMPLPPYIAARRAADAQDRTDYQTIFARRRGAAAAPTAALHFDPPLMAALAAAGIAHSFVTLHVGAGTFLPVKVTDPREHRMHAETGEISAATAAEIAATRGEGGRIVAVGTTSLRLLETAAIASGRVEPWSGATDLFIYPGFSFRAADALMTNFHLPRSTLMMLVSAFAGTERIRAIYAHAVASRYRFYSYGDASLLFRR